MALVRGFALFTFTLFATATPLNRRADCTTTTVVSGDSCSSLASRCGISGSDFTNYNGNICSTLQPGQKVCCSSGTLPSNRPKQNSDGSCASYTVKSGDSCSAIAGAYGLSTTDLATFNDKTTWGWAGCANLAANSNICLSTGTPPMPQPDPNAVCGPTKPGSSAAPGSDLSKLNPCPLNACCNRWGQCGATPDFCTAEAGPTGNPGTAPPGRNGCVSNCGTAVTNVRSGPAINVAYYESWSMGRPCAKMHADDLNVTKYTHYHWGFVNPDPNNYFLTINDTYGEWQRFLNMKNVKRIVTIGGWAFSQDAATSGILPRAMRKPKDFAMNVIFFMNIYGLDGVDIDWEYPGSDDMGWFVYFLYFLRANMPAGKTISIAVPASYGTLKNYPLQAINSYVDYIVYMTYDYHGQWDYGAGGIDGCPNGSCLRSHVNATETAWSLGMITKAGITTDRIVVGVASYGRSFKMTDPSCTGPTCTFTGPNSGAAVGTCTQEAGFLANAELSIFRAWGVKSTYDAGAGADWMIVPGNTWVSYLSDATKASRAQAYRSAGFAGTGDWAVSMQNY